MRSSRRSTITRREFLKATAFAGAAAIVSGIVPRVTRAATSPGRVVVVGGGLAGLTAAYRLAGKYRVPCTLYEAQDRLGGRVWTERGLAGGQWIERGAQFISTADKRLRRLARELGLRMIDLNKVYPPGETVYRFDGGSVSAAELQSDLEVVEQVAYAHFDEIVAPATWDTIDPATAAWDQVSVEQWLDDACPGGVGSTVGRYLKAYFESEYAGPIAEASALHMIYDFGIPFPGFDERYCIDGGNDLLVSGMADALPPESLVLERPLVATTLNVDGSYGLTFDTGGAPLEVEADVVIFALPFSTLRDVDLSGLPLDPRMSAAIAGLDVGLNSKVNLQFSSRAWEPAASGDSVSDLAVGPTFPTHPGQPGSEAILTTFGASDAAALYAGESAHGPASPAVVAANLAALEQLFPGSSAVFNGNAHLDFWPADPWVKGSYSYYKVGQFTAFAGIEAEPQGNVFFAGEHTARYKSRAQMNGAVETGERAARLARRAAR